MIGYIESLEAFWFDAFSFPQKICEAPPCSRIPQLVVIDNQEAEMRYAAIPIAVSVENEIGNLKTDGMCALQETEAAGIITPMISRLQIRKWAENWHDQYVSRLSRADAQLQPAILGLFVGLLTGVVIVAFRWLVEQSQIAILPGHDPEAYEALSSIWRLIIPVVSGLAIGMLFQAVSRDHYVVGIIHVMERLAYHQGQLTWKKFLLQFVGAGLAIIGGHSIGREGPSVHLGAATGSLMGQSLRVPNNNVRILVACGTAAAIAASFNTPLAGVVFAMEVVMLEYTITSFIPVILAAVSATGVTIAVYGNSPVFVIPEFSFNSLRELPYVVLLGLLCGVVATVFTRMVGWLGGVTRHWPFAFKTTMAGLIVGLAGLAYPEVMGVGYDTVSSAMIGELGLMLLLGILLFKVMATTAALGLGVPGGVVGPSLFMGAMLGSSVGYVTTMASPEYASDIGFYTVLGMAAMMASLLRAPLAALVAILEMTYTPTIIFPGMLAIVIAELTRSEMFHQDAIFSALLKARGLDINMNPRVQALQRIGVTSQMSKRFVVLPSENAIDALHGALRQEPHWILLQDGDEPLSVLPAIDLVRYLEEEKPTTRIDLGEIPAKRDTIKGIHKRASLKEADELMHVSGVDILYVYDMPAPGLRRVKGVIERSAIETSYRF